MIAAIYARKSTDQNGVAEDAKSVARQVEHGRAYAERKGWTVADEHLYIDDGISGAEFERRPALMRLLNALKPRPPFAALLVSDRDRIGREQIETSYILKQLLTAGVRVFEVKGAEGREITLSSPTDKIILAVEDFAAEVEREKARQRTTDAMVRKARAGLGMSRAAGPSDTTTSTSAPRTASGSAWIGRLTRPNRPSFAGSLSAAPRAAAFARSRSS